MGGDVKNVTIFGESGGGAKISCFIASPLVKGIVHKGIFESGAAGGFSPGMPMKKLEVLGEKFFAKLGGRRFFICFAEQRRMGPVAHFGIAILSADRKKLGCCAAPRRIA
jgi:carboxylesterase type B